MVARKKPRGKVAPQNRYDAAGSGRRLKGWTPPSSGPRRAIEGLQNIRNRARDSARNDWAGSSSVTKWATSIVGVGITPRFESEKHTRLWQQFVPQADADGVLDVYGLQTLGVRTWFDGGEVFLRRRPRDLDFAKSVGLAAPVQFQLIEPEMVPLLDADTYEGLPDGNDIRQGIERNRYGRRIAYWCYKEHPGDTPSKGNIDPSKLVRVPASEIRHVFEPKRPGQLRGVSELAPILTRLRNSGNFEDAVLDRQLLANLFAMFVTRSMPPNADDIDYDPETGLPVFYDKSGLPMAGLEPGISQTLLPGEDVKFANPPEAGTTYSDYMRSTHLGTAAGQGMPYEVMSGDIRDISDRSMRVVINEFRRFAEQRQWQIAIPMLCQPMVEWWADALLLAGHIGPRELAAARSPTHHPHGWEYIHPVQDIEGKVLAIENNLESRSSVISKRGDDPRQVAEDLKRDKELGLVPEKPEPPKPPKADPVASARAEELHQVQMRVFGLQADRLEAPPPAPAGALSITHQMFDRMQAQQEQFTAQMGRVADTFAGVVKAALERPINLSVQPPNVDVHAEVNPTPVTINNDVQPTPLVIHNNVQPADVKVELPDRRTETEVLERDDEGNISRVVHTETTIQ